MQSQIFLGKGHFKTFLLMKKFLFLKTIKNILSKYIPHEIITIDDRDPPWFNKDVKSLIAEKNKAWRLYIQSNKMILFLKNLLHFKSN